MLIPFPPIGVAATYAALLLSVLALWAGRRAWPVLALVATLLGYVSGILSGPAAGWLVLFAGCCALYSAFRTAPASLGSRVAAAAGALGIVAVALGLGTHALPGFHNLLVARDLVLTAGTAPYTLYLNFDKTMVGVLLVGLLLHGSLARSRSQWAEALRLTAPVAVITIAVVIVGSLVLGYVRVDPKWHALFWVWAPANLLMTCLSEEAFFRGFLQGEVRRLLGERRYAAPVAIGTGAVLFGLAHIGGGLQYALLATLAGAGYGYAYERTGRLEMAMLTHFALNATHFLAFTYPRVAG